MPKSGHIAGRIASSLFLILAAFSSVNGAAASNCQNYPANAAVTPTLLASRVQPPCTESAKLDTPGFSNPLDSLQHGFDLYSWLTFVSLNSPADTTSVFGANVPTVWESW